jgi:hypothetical protein
LRMKKKWKWRKSHGENEEAPWCPP